MPESSNPLQVLLIESSPGVGAAEAQALRAAGHTVRSCSPESTGARADAPFDTSLPVCVAVTDGRCPIDAGVDVALLTRHLTAGRPRLSEAGVLCALRQGVPLVVDTEGAADGFGQWATGFVHGDVVRACLEAADEGFDDLRASIARRTELVLTAEQVPPGSVTYRFEPDGPRLVITIVGPDLDPSVRQALGVRVLDAVRSSPRTYGQVNVAFEVTVPA